MKKSMLALLFGSALVLAACGGDDGESSGASTQSEGEKLTMQSCASCHGGNLEGRGNTPDLNKVGARLTEEEILDILLNHIKLNKKDCNFISNTVILEEGIPFYNTIFYHCTKKRQLFSSARPKVKGKMGAKWKKW